MSLFEKTLNGYGWVRIFLSPVVAGLLAGIILMYLLGDSLFTRITLCILVAAGAAIGLIWANNVRKKGSTFGFLNRISETKNDMQ
jgi:uncharacterized membrane protein